VVVVGVRESSYVVMEDEGCLWRGFGVSKHAVEAACLMRGMLQISSGVSQLKKKGFGGVSDRCRMCTHTHRIWDGT
jgi:hypothetical protein